MKHAGGRPTDYGPRILTESREYLDNCVDKRKGKYLDVNLPTVEGLSLYLDINKDTLYEWAKIHPEFSDVLGEVKRKQHDALVKNGLSGNYNPTIAKLILASKHNYVEKTENETTIKGINLTDLFKRSKNDEAPAN